MLLYGIEWKDLEGVWIREEVAAADFKDAEEQARQIAELFGTGEYRVEIFGRSM